MLGFVRKPDEPAVPEASRKWLLSWWIQGSDLEARVWCAGDAQRRVSSRTSRASAVCRGRRSTFGISTQGIFLDVGVSKLWTPGFALKHSLFQGAQFPRALRLGAGLRRWHACPALSSSWSIGVTFVTWWLACERFAHCLLSLAHCRA